MFRSHVLICGGTGCTSNHSADLITEFERQIKNAHLENDVQIVKTGCFGLCAVGPICIVYPEGAFYSEVKVDDVKEIVEEHLAKGRLVERLLYKDHKTAETVKSLHDSNFMKMQTRVALRNCGVINPENIDEYIGTDGYQALIKALTEMKPQDVIDVIKASGLRGRGGGGGNESGPNTKLVSGMLTYDSGNVQELRPCRRDPFRSHPKTSRRTS